MLKLESFAPTYVYELGHDLVQDISKSKLSSGTGMISKINQYSLMNKPGLHSI